MQYAQNQFFYCVVQEEVNGIFEAQEGPISIAFQNLPSLSSWPTTRDIENRQKNA